MFEYIPKIFQRVVVGLRLKHNTYLEINMVISYLVWCLKRREWIFLEENWYCLFLGNLDMVRVMCVGVCVYMIFSTVFYSIFFLCTYIFIATVQYYFLQQVYLLGNRVYYYSYYYYINRSWTCNSSLTEVTSALLVFIKCKLHVIFF